MHRIIFASAVFCFALLARAEIKTQTVEYKDGDATFKGYLAYDDTVSGKRPGVVVVPEWWGLNDYAKSRTEQLAKLGYVAFAADIYGDGFNTTDRKVAGEKATEVRGEASEPAQVMQPEPARELVDVDGVQPRIARQHFPRGAGRRIALENAGDIAAQCSEHAAILWVPD